MIALIIALAAGPVTCETVAVHDGDSVRCDAERVRLANIDAPELPGSPRCTPAARARTAGSSNPSWCDSALAIRSRDALAAFLSRGPVMIERRGVDRYGRTLARLSVNGRDAGEYLVSLGLAREWVR